MVLLSHSLGAGGKSGRHPLVNRFMALCLVLVLTLAESPLQVGTYSFVTPRPVTMVFGRLTIGGSSASVSCTLLGPLSTFSSVSIQAVSVVVVDPPASSSGMAAGCSLVSRLLIVRRRTSHFLLRGQCSVLCHLWCVIYPPSLRNIGVEVCFFDVGEVIMLRLTVLWIAVSRLRVHILVVGAFTSCCGRLPLVVLFRRRFRSSLVVSLLWDADWGSPSL